MSEVERFEIEVTGSNQYRHIKVPCGGSYVNYRDYEALQQKLDKALKLANACKNAEMTWEKAMMAAIGEDGPACVSKAIAVLKADRDAVVTENAVLKSAFNPEVIPEKAVEAFTETAIMDHDWNDTGEWSWVENDTDVIRAVLEAIKPETPATDAILNAVRAEGAVIASQSISKAVSCFQGVHAGAVMECADIAREVGIGISAGVVKGGSDE